MIPTSTSKLVAGDFCLIPRKDGRHVPFVYLCPVKDSSPKAVPTKIFSYALLHIKCFRENNTPIIGNLFDEIGKEVFDQIKIDTSDFSVGAKSRVWGYKTIFKYADQISA